MARKTTPRESASNEGTIIHGNVTAGTFIGRDQINYGSPQTVNIHNAGEFAAELRRLQGEIRALRQDLDEADAMQLDAVVSRVETALAEVEQPKPAGERIRATLEKAQKTIHLLDDSVKAAAGLGATLAGLGALALKLFGM